MFNVLYVAHELGRTLEQVCEMSHEELSYWLAFFKVKQEMIQKEQARQRRISQSKGKSGSRSGF